MPSPFTNAQIEAMSDLELDSRLDVAVGWATWTDDVADPTGASPWPWWKTPFRPDIWRRRVLELIGDEPYPIPPVICRTASICLEACEEMAFAYSTDLTPRENAEALAKELNSGVEA